MRILVCGGRDFSDYTFLKSILDHFNETYEIECIIEGEAKGADKLSAQWAKENNITCVPFPADWVKHKRAAGPIRNSQMLKEGKPDFVIAFPGGSGTNNMISQTKKAKIQILVIDQNYCLEYFDCT